MKTTSDRSRVVRVLELFVPSNCLQEGHIHYALLQTILTEDEFFNNVQARAHRFVTQLMNIPGAMQKPVASETDVYRSGIAEAFFVSRENDLKAACDHVAVVLKEALDSANRTEEVLDVLPALIWGLLRAGLWFDRAHTAKCGVLPSTLGDWLTLLAQQSNGDGPAPIINNGLSDKAAGSFANDLADYLSADYVGGDDMIRDEVSNARCNELLMALNDKVMPDSLYGAAEQMLRDIVYKAFKFVPLYPAAIKMLAGHFQGRMSRSGNR